MRMRVLLLVVVIVTMTAGAANAADLPLRHVVLFTSGVGFFEHEGLVHGDQTVTMSFRSDQINDILKSMVLQDHGGGTIGPVRIFINFYCFWVWKLKIITFFSHNIFSNFQSHF